MEERFYKVLNKILINFIPKTKLNQFKDLILENDIDIEKLYFPLEPLENGSGPLPFPKPNRQKLSIEEIRKRLKNKMNHPSEEQPRFEIINTSDKEEVLKSCDSIAKKIIYEDKKNKVYYYHFGKNLSLLKEHYCLKAVGIKERSKGNIIPVALLPVGIKPLPLPLPLPFHNFIEDRYKIKLSTIFKYLKFYNLCEKYDCLLDCDLSFSEIMNNVPEILSL